MSGWVVEGDIVRLRVRDESWIIHLASRFIRMIYHDEILSLPSSIVKIPQEKYKAVLSAIFDGNIADI